MYPLRRAISVYLRRVAAFEVVPEASDGPPSSFIAREACLKVIEDSKLFLVHDVGVWLSLDPAPDCANGPVESCINAGMYFSSFTVSDELKGLGDADLVGCRGSVVTRVAHNEKLCGRNRV